MKPCPPALLPDPRGFTLLEILVVISILAAVSVISLGGYARVLERSDDSLVRVEMQEIAKALRQFKSDTGYYPKTGPFALSIDGGGGAVTDVCLPGYIGSRTAQDGELEDDEKRQWFYSPANLYQLTATESPLKNTGHLLETWDPETGRGWRGPYLKGFKDGYVDIGDKINGVVDEDDDTPTLAEGDIKGYPLEGNDVPDVIAVADPYDHAEEPTGGTSVDNTLLDWSDYRRRLPVSEEDDPEDEDYVSDREDAPKEYWGRPYLVFGLDQTTVTIGASIFTGPVIICMGPNGEFDNGICDTENKKDDLVLDVN